ncbi:VCBS repeat-containing protein, partial [bacterium]|nr:VCBS repeat-containing protein [bacterium]
MIFFKKKLILVFLFSFSTLFAQAPNFQGFSSKVTGDIYGQVKVINDIDGDGKKDMVFGATDGQIHIWSSRGKEVMAGLWPKHTGGPVMADVAVADLDGDNVEEIIAGSYDGVVYGLNIWGKELWTVDTRGTIQLSGPEVSDVDSSGILNVFVGSHAGKVSRIDNQGRLVWEVPVGTKVSSKVVISDIDGDGRVVNSAIELSALESE